MITLSQLRDIVARYLTVFPEEENRLSRLNNLLSSGTDPLDRTNMQGHVTASAIVLSPTQHEVLTIGHRHIGRRLQPGGHYERPEDTQEGPLSLWQRAQKEVREETGITPIELHSWHTKLPFLVPLDIDTHDFPARPAKNETDHLHHDFLFLAQYRGQDLTFHDFDKKEVKNPEWTPLPAALAFTEGTFKHIGPKLRRFVGVALLLAFVMGGAPTAEAGKLREMIEERRAAREAEKAPPETSTETATQATKSGVLRDLAYGADAKQKLDVYLPTAPASGRVLVMVHGGAWKIGDKANDGVAKDKAAFWGAKGDVLVSVNYRLLPQAAPLDQAKDVAKALAYVQAHAATWGADPHKLVLMGHSAGAHLVALLTSSLALAEGQGAQPWRGTVVLDSAALDVANVMKRDHLGFYDEAFGSDPAYWAATSPAAQLVPNASPMMLVCSTERRDDPCLQARGFSVQAQKLGVRTVINPQAKSHGQINGDLGVDPVYTQSVDAFIQSLF